MARGGLYFLGATAACGQLQQTGAYPISLGCDHRVTFPEWRTSGECAPLDGDHEMAPAEVAAGAASVEVSADADEEMAPAEVAAGMQHQRKWALVQILPTIKTQRQMVD